MGRVPSFDDWEGAATAQFRADPLWRMMAYRLASYALAAGWEDACRLQRHPITRAIATQLYKALGSIAANIAEGYSRSSGRDRAHFLEYGLGSARESRCWYDAGRPVLGVEITTARRETLDSICRLLLVAIPRERTRQVRPTRQRPDVAPGR